MGLVDLLLSSQGGSTSAVLAQKFGLSPEEAASAVSALAPALSAGIQQNIGAQGGIDSLLGALLGGQHQQYVDNPATLDSVDTITDGNAILGHILGSKDVSRQVARQASEQTGIGADVLKKMLPIVAAMMMGVLSKQSAGAGLGGQPRDQAGGGLLDVLGTVLGGGQSSSTAGTLIGMLGRLMK